MKTLKRDTWLTIGLIALLIAVIIAAAIQQAKPPAPPALASFSSGPDGALALHTWLQDIGYRVSNNVSDTFEVPPSTAIILILEPSEPITASEWNTLDQWVDRGGTLVLAGSGPAAAVNDLHYGFDLRYLGNPSNPLTPQVPLFLRPPITSNVDAQPVAHLVSDRHDFVTLLADPHGTVMVAFDQGSGRVFISATPFPFSNNGLKFVGNPELVLNVIGAARESGTIWFDEWHHGVRPTHPDNIGSLRDWLVETLAGQSLLYVMVILFVGMVLQGRRFGRPLQRTEEKLRRAPLEYVTALANLNRRAGHRRWALDQYHDRLKIDLGRRYHLSPALDDEEFVRKLTNFNSQIIADDLSRLLASLRQKNVSESELVQLAAQVSAWLDERQVVR